MQKARHELLLSPLHVKLQWFKATKKSRSGITVQLIDCEEDKFLKKRTDGLLKEDKARAK